MKRIILITIIGVMAQLCFAQSIDFDLLTYKGLDFYSSKSLIIEKLGNPGKAYQPNYECGFLSSEEQGIKYYSLEYGKVKFTGNEKEGYVLESVEFDCSILLNYGNYELTYQTDLVELGQIFGREITKHGGNNWSGRIFLYHGKADDGIVLEIREGKLSKFEYWSPC